MARSGKFRTTPPCWLFTTSEISSMSPRCGNGFRKAVIVEDAREGLFGSYDGIPAGTGSLMGSISFFGNKDITSGEGGAVFTGRGIIRNT